jgi:hypothetical protein
MKISLGKKNEGSVLLATVLVIVVVGVVLASYLKMISNETYTVSRSQCWNQCVPVMEAGVEEALAQLHYCNDTLNLGGNGWIVNSNGYYQKTRSVGTDGSYCIATIQPVMPPVIYCTGYVPVPGSSTFISRQVRVTTMNQGVAYGGLTAKGTIKITASGFVDSFDSSKAPYDPNNPGTNVIALTDATNAGAITMGGSATNYGIAVTGPGGTVVLGGKGTVMGGVANDANVEIDDIPQPNTQGWSTAMSSGKIGGTGTNYNSILYTGKYAVNSWNINAPVAVNGNAVLYVASSMSIQGSSAYVYLTPGSSLTVYLGGDASFTSGGFINASGFAGNLYLYGLPGCSNIKFSGQETFIGQIDAPDANVSFTGGATAYGSVIADNINIGGGSAVHYDMKLGGYQTLVMNSWNEL